MLREIAMFTVVFVATVIIVNELLLALVASGQDIDPRYYCIENPHYRSCDLQLQKDRQEIMDLVQEAITLADNDSAWYNDSMKRSLNSSK